MYHERIRRTTPKQNPNSHPQFFIRRSEIPFDERLAFESVCATLIESGFGPGNADPWILDWSDRPELEPAPLYDLCDEGEAVPYYLSPLGRNWYQVVETIYQRAKQMGFIMTGVSGHNLIADTSSNQGRGSP